MMMKSLFTLTFCFCITLLSTAQMSAGFSLGCINYSGDFSKGAFDPKEVNIGYGVYVAKRYNNPKFALKGHLLRGAISGNDNNYLERYTRGLKFTSPITFVGTTVEYMPLAKKYFDEKGDFVPQKNLFFSTGLGFTFFNPKVQGLDVKAPDRTAEISKTMVTIPLNIGMRFDIVKDWSIAVEASYYVPFTDYLDGVSAAGTPTNNDKYFTYGFTLSKKWGDIKTDNNIKKGHSTKKSIKKPVKKSVKKAVKSSPKKTIKGSSKYSVPNFKGFD